MDLRVLRYFVTVAREECLTSAAMKLKISQPTLSRQLKELEDEFGAQLFNRGSRGQRITLTEKGALLRRRAEEMLQLADKTCCELSCGDCVSGNIYIGVCAHMDAALALLGRAFSQLHERYPEVGLCLERGGSCTLYDRLTRGSLDFALLPDDFTCPTLEQLPLPKAQRLGVYVKQDAKAAGMTHQALSLCDLALPSDEDDYESLLAWLEGGISAPHISVRYAELQDALSCLDASRFAVLGRELGAVPAPWRFVGLDPELATSGRLSRLKRGTLSPASALLYKIIKDILQTETAQDGQAS